jgi:hypothetical protein
MCHPKSGDLPSRRTSRTFSWVCVRGGMRAGSHVLDLSRRVPSRRPGHDAAHSTGAPAKAASFPRSSQVVPAEFVTETEQQIGAARVQAGRAVNHQPANSNRRAGCSMSQAPITAMSRSICRQSALWSKRAAALPSVEARPEIVSAKSLVRTYAALPDWAAPANAFSASFRRCLRNSADGDQISTGLRRTLPTVGEYRTSVIVLVTSDGNVTVRAN